MAKELKFSGSVKDVDANGAEREVWPLTEAIEITEKNSYRGKFITDQTDTAIPFGAVTTAKVVLVRVLTNGEAITVKHSGGSETMTIKSECPALLTNITGLSFSWTKVTNDLDLEVLIAG